MGILAFTEAENTIIFGVVLTTLVAFIGFFARRAFFRLEKKMAAWDRAAQNERQEIRERVGVPNGEGNVVEMLTTMLNNQHDLHSKFDELSSTVTNHSNSIEKHGKRIGQLQEGLAVLRGVLLGSRPETPLPPQNLTDSEPL